MDTIKIDSIPTRFAVPETARYVVMIESDVIGYGEDEAAAWDSARTEAERASISLDGAECREIERGAATLRNYKTNETIRAATQAEYEASMAAAERDGGAGVIVVDGVSCYVDG